MSKGEKKAWQGKVFSEIAGHLKNYPFLLIALAAIVVLSLVVAFDIEKLKTLKTLLMVMIVLPIACQFVIEFTKLMKGEKGQKAAPSQVGRFPEDVESEKEHVELRSFGAEPAQITIPVRKKTSALAIVGLVLVLFLLVAIGGVMNDDETVDSATALGAFALSSVSLFVALLAMISIKLRQSRGRVIAIIDFVLSAICVLASIGMYMGAENSITNGGSSGSGGETAIIYLAYAGDQDGCMLQLGFEIDGHIVTPSSNLFPVSGLSTGEAYYTVAGTIESPASGSCVASGEDRSTLKTARHIRWFGRWRLWRMCGRTSLQLADEIHG